MARRRLPTIAGGGVHPAHAASWRGVLDLVKTASQTVPTAAVLVPSDSPQQTSPQRLDTEAAAEVLHAFRGGQRESAFPRPKPSGTGL
jgi:hypothetical protein